MGRTVFRFSPFIEIFQRNSLMVVVNVQNYHLFVAVRTGKRIITKGKKDGFSPTVEGHHNTLFFCSPRMMQAFINFPVSGIQAIVADHFEILFRDMLHEELDEIYGGDGLFDIYVILMAVVVKSNGISRFIISVDPFCGNDRTAEISTDILCNGFGI